MGLLSAFLIGSSVAASILLTGHRHGRSIHPGTGWTGAALEPAASPDPHPPLHLPQPHRVQGAWSNTWRGKTAWKHCCCCGKWLQGNTHLEVMYNAKACAPLLIVEAVHHAEMLRWIGAQSILPALCARPVWVDHNWTSSVVNSKSWGLSSARSSVMP